jgi:hypothetical protein
MQPFGSSQASAGRAAGEKRHEAPPGKRFFRFHLFRLFYQVEIRCLDIFR